MKRFLFLYRQLRRHRSLAEKRTLDLEKNKAAKWLIYIMTGCVVLYLVMFAIIFALAANGMRSMSTIEFITTLLPFFFSIDFFVRFMAQQTPAQIIKPYVLLPMPRYTTIDCFLLGQMAGSSNFIWFFMLVPYCLMSVVFSFGVGASLHLLVFFWLFELCISQFYLIVRTLLNDTLLWWVLPVAVIAAWFAPMVDWTALTALADGQWKKLIDFDQLITFYSHIGLSIEDGRPWAVATLLALLGVLYAVNRRVQYTHVRSELSRTEKVTTVKNARSLGFLDRLGETGLYLGLEIKTQLRNKNPRKSLIMVVALIVVFSMIIIFTDVYDSSYMGNFWCLYNYTIFGAMTLVKVMCNEGNFIDGLMVRKENILQILRAKYYYNCMVLLLPFCLMMPTVFSGKWSLLMVLSYGVFTAEFQFFLLFQLAVINCTTQPLNTKFISKNGLENSTWQVVIEMVCLFVPVILASLLQVTLGNTAAFSIMLAIGLAFVLTHRLWLRNIYNRFMLRRYKNLEGFRATR